MRAIVQRVGWAKVEVEGHTVGAIERGLLVYLGVGKADDVRVATAMAAKIVGLRLFENDSGKLDRNVVDVGGRLLVVSQFTLYGDVRRGRRPSFDEAMAPEPSEAIYEHFLREAMALVPVASGRFRAHMAVSALNDGPVTLTLDSNELWPRKANV